MNDRPAVLFWSGGKDSALTLLRLWRSGELYPATLLTRMLPDMHNDFHGIHSAFFSQLEISLDHRVSLFEVEADADNEAYREAVLEALEEERERHGAVDLVFGDIYLEEMREFREDLFAGTDYELHFPLWGADTGELADEFERSDFEAVVTCIDEEKLPEEMLGDYYNWSFLQSLPEGVDPCGENGEFHTFVFDGPRFNSKLDHLLSTSSERIHGHYLQKKVEFAI